MPILGNPEHASPAHVKIVHQRGTWESFERTGKIDFLIHALECGLAARADCWKIRKCGFHLEVITDQTRFEPVRGESAGEKHDSGEQRHGSFDYRCNGHGAKTRMNARFVNRRKRMERPMPLRLH